MVRTEVVTGRAAHRVHVRVPATSPPCDGLHSLVVVAEQGRPDQSHHDSSQCKASNIPLVLDCLEEGLETLPQQEQEEDRPQPHEDGEADPPGGEQKYPCSSSSHLSDAVAFSRRSEKPQWFYYSQLTIDLLPEA